MQRSGWAPPLALALLLPGCSDGGRPRPVPAASAAADKAALFGDPSLVPTREGERARAELGLAQEIAGALELLPAVERTRVDVELPARGRDGSPRVLAVVRCRDATDVDPLTDQARRIAQTVAGPDASIELLVAPGVPSPSTPAPARPWPLLLGMLGLGYFGGTLVERARRLQRARPRRRAR